MVPPTVDIAKLDGFMLDTRRLLSSELVALATAEEFRAAVLLWCRAWQQTPAASLPNDDRVLASFAGVELRRWPKVREMALRGFVECSDGRLYHHVLAADALRAWEALVKRHGRTKAATEARKTAMQQERHEQRNDGTSAHRNDERHVDRNDRSEPLRNEVPTVARDGTGRDGNMKEPPATLGVSEPRPPAPAEPGGGRGEVTQIVDGFDRLRREHWPNHPDLPAPRLTLETEARGHLARGGPPALILDVVGRGMAAMARKGQRPPGSLAAFGRSLDDAIAKRRHAESGGDPGPRYAPPTAEERAAADAHLAAIARAAETAN